MTKEEFQDALENDDDIEAFTNLETLFDVHGEWIEYYEIEYDDFEDIFEN